MANPLDLLRNWLGARPAPKHAAAPLAARISVLDLSRERLRAALSLSIGPGVAKRIAELGPGVFPDRAIRSIELLENLLTDTSLTGRRFGTMLRELGTPDLLVLALLLRDIEPDTPAGESLTAVRAVCASLELSSDSCRFIEFLLNDDLRMSKLAFRSDPDDEQAVEAFAAYLNSASLFNTFTTEEHLKMLTLMTLVVLDADGALTPFKSELLWRLFVDTYNRLVKAYGDQLIDAATLKRTALYSNKPPTLPEEHLIEFLEGLPKRYLTLFDPSSIYEHVRACRQMAPDDVHGFLKTSSAGVWELTVATLDKPFLFSNICGVLSYLGMDILNGQAMTSSRGLVLDVFRFHDPDGQLERSQPMPLLIDVVAGRVDIERLLQNKHGERVRAAGARIEPIIAFDNDASARYTIVEIVAEDAPGLLYRISRALSRFRCEIENVVIATEEHKAIDTFHVTRGGAKVPDAEELSLTEALEQALIS